MTEEDRRAYRAIVEENTCPFCEGVCPYGIPGCPRADWLLRFDELGWIDVTEGMIVDDLEALRARAAEREADRAESD